MPYSADVPIMSNQNLTIDTGEGETASKAMRMKVNFHQRGKIIIWEHNGRKETLSNEVFVQLAKWYIGEVQSFEQNMNSLMGRYKQGNKIGNKTIELKNSWMGPEGLTELLHRNLRLNRNMFACSVNQCALRKYHTMFDEDGIFGSQGDAYQDRTWNYEEDILAHANPEYTEKDIAECLEAAVACARRGTPTRIIMTIPKWESKTYWKKILDTPGAQIVTDIPAN
jgi:hypothetical protein